MPLIARWVGHIPAGRVSAVELMSGEKPQTVSWNRCILTDIYLWHACSYQEINNGNGRAGGCPATGDTTATSSTSTARSCGASSSATSTSTSGR